jgi:predicted adenylyl cyclase CyaB
MPSNIEIKAALKNRDAVESVAARLSDSPPEIIYQHDVFFRCEGARLKLRIFAPNQGELIRYERPDVSGTRRSRYKIARTADPQALLAILTETLGSTGAVTKKRTLYRAGQTRIHIDEVEGLGEFLELEVVLRPQQSETEGAQIADGLLAELGIEKSELIGGAYVDLLRQRARDSAQA